MTKNIATVLLMIYSLFFLSCDIYKKKKTCGVGEYSGLIGLNIHDVQIILEKDYYVKEIEVQDEGHTWKALLCSKDSLFRKNPLLLETSWLNKKVINRISILNNSISIHNGFVRVGTPVHKIRKFISNKIPNSPDGYFFLKDKYCPNVEYELKITEKDTTLYYGIIDNSDEVPDNQIIKKIIIK